MAHLLTACPLAPLSVMESSQDILAQTSTIASPLPVLPQLQLQLQLQQRAKSEQPPKQPPAYYICCAVKSIWALWHKWTEGLRDNPSIAALNSKWGSRWQANWQSKL